MVRNLKIEEELMQLREQKTELLMTKSNLIEKLVAYQDNKELKDKYDKLKEQFDGAMRNMTDTAREQADTSS